MHELFKKDNGYSDLEISQKRTSLENVLIPETLETHKQRLESAGFKSAEVWFQYFNFASLIAMK
jgi:tRNA (cmo5U34)-methyltransferase